MVLNVCCVLIILAVAYAMANEGLFLAVVMLINVMLAGFITYSFWEPAADRLEGLLAGTFAAGMEDHLAMTVLFAVSLGVLRLATGFLAHTRVEFNPNVDRFGGALVGLVSGYLVAGFLVCAMETLPLSTQFLGFAPRSDNEEQVRSYFPPDRVWSSLMRYAGAHVLSGKPIKDSKNPFDRYRVFDPNGTFELRYLRYRRHGEKDGKKLSPLQWQKEIEVKDKG